MTYIVTVNVNGVTWPLRGTTWAYSMDRAQVFASREEAQATLDRAKKFMKATVYKKAVIVEVAA
jgi:esterase/lipase superfamily enzyme